MTATGNTAALRAKNFSIVNVRGNITVYSHSMPFVFGGKSRAAEQQANGMYQISKPGQFATQTEQPWTMAVID